MDFLKSAVASAMAKGPPFPYNFGDKVDLDPSIWTLHNGTRREDGSNCSIFSFDITTNRSALPLAKNALKKLRTLRHPGVIKVLDTVETDSYIYIATERLVPLRWHVKRKSLSPETAKWGLYSIATYGSLVPDSGRYTPPELAKSGWDAIKKGPHSAVDAYEFAALIFEVFNGTFNGSDQAGQTKNVPPNDFPEDFFKMKVLPELLKSVEFGGGGPKAFGVVMKIATKLSSEDFEAKITPVLIRLFGNPDRAIRVCLLDNLPLMIDRLSQRIVNDKIFPQIVTGFTDIAPVVREQTLKSVLTLITKLSDRTINGELLRYLAKTANDEQPGIRTNTTICLGKIAKYLGTSSRGKVLIAAFTRSLRDPFVHARNASLMALAVTSDCFSDEDCAVRIVPAVCPSLIDKEKVIRDQASKTIDVYLAKIKKAAAGMPDSVLPPESAVSAAGGPRMSTPQPAESAAASWAGWAISSFTNKLSTAAGEIQSSSTPVNGSAAAAPPQRPATTSQTPSTSSASNLHRQALKSPTPSAYKDPFHDDPALNNNNNDDNDFDNDDAADAWGDMDDMADEDNDNDGAAGYFAEANNKPTKTTTTTTTTTTTLPKRDPKPTSASASATPFDDGSEPDFAGWLAAQAQKKTGAKGLPKGLAKTGGTAKKTTVAAKPKAAAPAKKIDMKPKQTDEDDGWGGW
ncbi:hypothetical protein CHGG_07080 [Chaetomium globosum CBS 148.51]|uniref:Protein kinase domain-containing protein n=1 Tax=Chaetomium globosum (strain ATCC 6205 / CBS 148.51 / DSM 1962 / NBRC 6347 / NRRL 1970) TaxID=306901 RepID=Q2GY74_CHAGB|nr:uncharacterized protein CHGG_07080 [Chaetomium globosum CBS 148.51]EAQ85827.1 hypothetical protein CHGG_07080 [Chaetomium globosum CBS 148.51]